MMNIAFIGIGVMGQGMVANLLKAGYKVDIYSRTKSKGAGVIAAGAIWHDSIKEAVKDADIIITIVGYPKDVEEVYFKEGNILSSAKKNALLIDMTTSSPNLAEKIYKAAKEHHLRALDAPVSGGDTGAKNGTLTIMAGGDKEDFDSAYEVLSKMGKNIYYMGSAGSGQHCKMANQIAISGCVTSVAEALSYAKKAELDAEHVLTVISGGAAGSWQMKGNGPKMLSDDMAPGFYIKHFIKDMKLAKEEADKRQLDLPVLSMVLNMYEQLAENGMEDLGTQAIIKNYE
ncbi:MAG: NAD(P)-dependent oxidoreductase [Eubacteriales bacterium]|nr:NAD(P)-dependent oxidoreductase [Eubacteriales bacterium]